MSAAQAVSVGQSALWAGLLVGMPVLLAALGVGLIVSLLQAVTQVQETTLSFLPKLLAVAAVLVLLGPWMLRQLIDFTTAIWQTGGLGGGLP
jgi:flagellar biosynthetic protein FliQ